MRYAPFAFAVALFIAGCGRSGPVPPRPPIYPYWTLEQMPDGPASAGRLPPPAATAVLVAPGYLAASTEGMGDVADDFLMDPTVFVFDGVAWHTGRYVDRDHRFRLALIRADVPGTPLALPTEDAAVTRLIGIPPRIDGEAPLRVLERPVVPCIMAPSWLEEGMGRYRRRALTRCIDGRVEDLSGGIMLDATGALTGIQVNPIAASSAVGPSGSEIRAFIDLYFASWGRYVDPRPVY